MSQESEATLALALVIILFTLLGLMGTVGG
jgi:hypothetical protein